MITKLSPSDPDRETTFDDDGAPDIAAFSNALSIWMGCQEKYPLTVADAAMAFNATPQVIREAVDWNTWLVLCKGDIIESEGA